MKQEYIQFVGIGDGVLTAVSMLPQLIRKEGARSFIGYDTNSNVWHWLLDMVWFFKK